MIEVDLTGSIPRVYRDVSFSANSSEVDAQQFQKWQCSQSVSDLNSNGEKIHRTEKQKRALAKAEQLFKK